MSADANGPQGGPKPYANPYLAGILLGLVLLASFVTLGAGLGASGGIARIAAWVSLGVANSHTLGSQYFGRWGAEPLDYYLVFMFVGTVAGALFSALLANRARIQVERGAAASVGRRLGYALAGGVLVGFASRLAQGCTSGQALSGGALMLTGSLVFMLCLFASGYAAAWFVRGQWHD
ncbi:MAG: YeeE/YedE thiosulfate transporter family protein [Deferrisomatales bacterium]|nr:YeeE/YedE thiosulfate transporter family protein [Deferrisomatales bacterium]